MTYFSDLISDRNSGRFLGLKFYKKYFSEIVDSYSALGTSITAFYENNIFSPKTVYRDTEKGQNIWKNNWLKIATLAALRVIFFVLCFSTFFYDFQWNILNFKVRRRLKLVTLQLSYCNKTLSSTVLIVIFDCHFPVLRAVHFSLVVESSSSRASQLRG